jgi:hypothetical protein
VPPLFGPFFSSAVQPISTLHTVVQREAEFLDEIQAKVLIVFWQSVTSQLCLEISISSNSCNLVQFLQFIYCTLYRRKEESPIENHTSFRMVKEIHSKTSSLKTLEIKPRNLKEIVCS